MGERSLSHPAPYKLKLIVHSKTLTDTAYDQSAAAQTAGEGQPGSKFVGFKSYLAGSAAPYQAKAGAEAQGPRPAGAPRKGAAPAEDLK